MSPLTATNVVCTNNLNNNLLYWLKTETETDSLWIATTTTNKTDKKQGAKAKKKKKMEMKIIKKESKKMNKIC